MGVFVWARAGLTCQKWRLPARAERAGLAELARLYAADPVAGRAANPSVFYGKRLLSNILPY